VIGNGKVAIDVARMLMLSADELAPTDKRYELEVSAQRVREVSSSARGRRRRRSPIPRARARRVTRRPT